MAKKNSNKITLATTLVEVVNLYSEQNKYNSKKQIRKSFCDMYSNVAKKLVDSKANVTLSKFDTKVLSKFDSYLLANCSASTRVQYYNALKSAINNSVLNASIAFVSPFNQVPRNERPRKEKNTEIKYLSVDEITRLKEGANLDNEVERAFLFSYYTGLRLSDIKNLKSTDIKRINTIPTIVKQTQKTGAKVVIPLSVEAVAVLEHTEPKKDYFFKLPEYRKTIERELEKMANRLGIDTHVTFHVARHSFAVQCVRNGVRIEVISKALGHSNIATTQIYAEIDEFTAVEALQVANL